MAVRLLCSFLCLFVVLPVCCIVSCVALLGFGLVCFRLAWFGLVVWFALSCFVVLFFCGFVPCCLFVCCVCVVCFALLSGLFYVIRCVPTKGSRPAGCMFQAHPLQEATRGSFWLKQLSSP